MMGDAIYIPIMCCDQEMSEVWKDGKRVMAFCQICKKVYRPTLVGIKYYTIYKLDKNGDIDNFIPDLRKTVQDWLKEVFSGYDPGSNDVTVNYEVQRDEETGKTIIKLLEKGDKNGT